MFREFIYRLPLGVKGGFAPLDYLIINPPPVAEGGALVLIIE